MITLDLSSTPSDERELTRGTEQEQAWPPSPILRRDLQESEEGHSSGELPPAQLLNAARAGRVTPLTGECHQNKNTMIKTGGITGNVPLYTKQAVEGLSDWQDFAVKN